MTPPRFDAVVLAGGASRRMGGGDKTRMVVGAAAMLDRVVAALVPAERIVVVGEQRDVGAQVTWTREEPPGSGPAAALRAGLMSVMAERVVVVAADLPFLTTGVVRRLVAAIDGDGAVPVDDEGADQWLCSAWRTAALRDAHWDAGNGSLRQVMATLRFARVSYDADERPPWLDCDTPEDLQRARELL
jgi:molybdopterin-guanine dinucleotide biosynthesis protein A